ncbi:hypothetical protein RBU61_03090 [Tissierella sp. MB52-C2]|uniref:CsxC family protein n=1 Tax=Tissierella sp. MB52-C2 TaxID=3070999 RepID=UPI00280BDC15|nr:hypothetical protein [Tissierella sp. MB52-C2]WMM25669.1 hypothetical protein RBU61_03090 [Tissierella sp. MB52-C2]
MNKHVEGLNVSNVSVVDSNLGHSHKIMTSPAKVCNVSSKHHEPCVDVHSQVLDNCKNIPITPRGITSGVVVKIPVVLAELTIRFNVNALIRLPEPALEVKDIKKKLKITQCTLLQPTNILFIKGFVRKNIDFSTAECSNWKGVCGDIRHCTVDVPFECSTPIEFFTPPETLALNSRSEFEFLKVSDLPNKHFAEKDQLLSGDLSEFNQFTTENFNELPFCELIRARIFEFDEFIDRKHPHDREFPFEEREFKKIEEKMVIELTLKVLQNRQVQVPSVGGTVQPPHCHEHPHCCSVEVEEV